MFVSGVVVCFLLVCLHSEAEILPSRQIKGIIGASATTAINAPQENSTTSEDCAWFGTSPFCNGECPSDYFYIHRTARKSPKGEELTFGGGCILGSKVQCCKIERTDCHWAGTWISLEHEDIFQCEYSPYTGNCGSIECVSETTDKMHAIIKGSLCNKVHFKTKRGLQIGDTKCGFMKISLAYNRIDSWHKTA